MRNQAPGDFHFNILSGLYWKIVLFLQRSQLVGAVEEFLENSAPEGGVHYRSELNLLKL